MDQPSLGDSRSSATFGVCDLGLRARILQISLQKWAISRMFMLHAPTGLYKDRCVKGVRGFRIFFLFPTRTGLWIVHKHGCLKEVGVIQDPIHNCASNRIIPPGTIS